MPSSAEFDVGLLFGCCLVAGKFKKLWRISEQAGTKNLLSIKQ